MTDPTDYAGYRAHSRTRTTGTTVVLLDGGPAGLDTDGGRWSTVCEGTPDTPHGGIVSHYTIADARDWLRHPESWCPYCMGEATP